MGTDRHNSTWGATFAVGGADVSWAPSFYQCNHHQHHCNRNLLLFEFLLFINCIFACIQFVFVLQKFAMSFKTKWLYVWSAYAMISISIDYFLQASSSCICHIPYPYKDNNLNRRLPTNDLAEAVMPPFIVNTLKLWYNEQVCHTLFVHYMTSNNSLY